MIKRKQKNTKECGKLENHISNKLHMIYISSNNDRYPVSMALTQLH